MILMSASPIVTANYDKEIDQGKEFKEVSIFDLPVKSIDDLDQELTLAPQGVLHAVLSKQMLELLVMLGTSTTSKDLGQTPTVVVQELLDA